jgi:hypothetical protein
LKRAFLLKRKSLSGAKGGCSGLADLSLEVKDGELVGAGEDHKARCSGKDLENASVGLTERGFLPTDLPHNFTITIKKRGTIPVWKPDGGADLPTYELEAKGISGTGPKSLCGEAPWSSIILAPQLRPWLKKTQAALIVQGETYTKEADVDQSGDNWFNIACAGSGIAKMRLLGFDPMNKSVPKEQRITTLKMITAKYCKKSGSWTKDGTEILMRDTGAQSPPPPGLDGVAEKIGPIEARWGAQGALCVSHLRLWNNGGDCKSEEEKQLVGKLRALCSDVPECDESKPCVTTSAGSDAVWNTCTVDHIKHN